MLVMPLRSGLAFIHSVDDDAEVHTIKADGTGDVDITDNDTFENIGTRRGP